MSEIVGYSFAPADQQLLQQLLQRVAQVDLPLTVDDQHNAADTLSEVLDRLTPITTVV